MSGAHALTVRSDCGLITRAPIVEPPLDASQACDQVPEFVFLLDLGIVGFSRCLRILPAQRRIALKSADPATVAESTGEVAHTSSRSSDSEWIGGSCSQPVARQGGAVPAPDLAATASLARPGASAVERLDRFS